MSPDKQSIADVQIILCDMAQTVGARVHVFGGGLTVWQLGTPLAVAVIAEIFGRGPAEGRKIQLSLIDADGRPVHNTQGLPVVFTMAVGQPDGPSLDNNPILRSAVNVAPGALALTPGQRYRWDYQVDDQVVASAAFRCIGVPSTPQVDM